MTGTLLAAGLALVAAPGAASDGDWRTEMGTFRIGMMADPAIGPAVVGLQEIRGAFARALGMPVEIFVARDLPALVTAQAEGRINYSIMSATAYATAWLNCACVRPLAAPIGTDGSTGLRAALLAKRGRFVTADEIDGRIAIGPPDSLTGNLIPVSMQSPATGTATRDRLTMVSSRSEAEELLATDEVDAAFGWIVENSSPPEEMIGLKAGFSVLWSSPPYRYGPHVVRTDLDEEAVDLLLHMLVGLRDSDEAVYLLLERHHGGGFEPATHDDYGPVVDALEVLRGRHTEP